MSMVWIGVGAAVLGAGASVYGANNQAKGAEKAGQINMDMFNVLNRQQHPYMQGGYGAMGRLNTLLGLNPRPTPTAQTAPPGSTPSAHPMLGATASDPRTRLLQQAIAQAMAQGGGGSSGFRPTPGGGVEPIMQVGPDMHIPRDPRRDQVALMRDLLRSGRF
jgi:hypothetical protein